MLNVLQYFSYISGVEDSIDKNAKNMYFGTRIYILCNAIK